VIHRVGEVVRNIKVGAVLTLAGATLIVFGFQNCSQFQATGPANANASLQATATGSSGSKNIGGASSVCTPGSMQACSGSNGTGSQICAANGSGFGSCVLNSCDTGFSLNAGACVVPLCTAGEYTFGVEYSQLSSNSYQLTDEYEFSQTPYQMEISSVQSDGTFTAVFSMEVSPIGASSVTGTCQNGQISFPGEAAGLAGAQCSGAYGLPSYTVNVYTTSGMQTLPGSGVIVTCGGLTLIGFNP
jgi:hypothetical protein